MIGLYIRTLLKGRFIGQDVYGNRYYCERSWWPWSRSPGSRRWVLYKGLAEASKIPAEWHSWLHGGPATPLETASAKYPWQKPHQPNLTGTPNSYQPSVLAAPKNKEAPKYYEPWTPS